MDFHPAVVHLLGCCEAFYANAAGGISNDDFVTWTIGLGTNFALDSFTAALEEVEHAEIIARVRPANGSACEGEIGKPLPQHLGAFAHS